MLAPQLATMLVVLTTDAVVPAADLDAALRAATRVSFDRLDSDGCMSTNDTVTVMASGASGITPTPADFTDALDPGLHRPRHAAAQGRRGRRPRDRHHRAQRRLRGRGRRGRPQRRPQQPLQGRRLRQRPQLGPGARQHRHHPGGVRPRRPRRRDERRLGLPAVRRPAEDPATVDLTGREVSVTIDLKSGDARATVWTNDLTHAYVHENSAYSS